MMHFFKSIQNPKGQKDEKDRDGHHKKKKKKKKKKGIVPSYVCYSSGHLCENIRALY